MINLPSLIKAFQRNLQIIELQAKGLSHEESLIQLPFRGNCLNWVVGHLVANRCNILRLLGADDPRESVNLDHYERESDPILGQEDGVLPLEELLSLLKDCQRQLEQALEGETAETLQRQAPYRDRPEQPLSYWLFFLYFHDTYHTGQTEILRQASGVDDKII